MANRIQTLLDVEYPIVQAPMTYIARAELAAAVSEADALAEAGVRHVFTSACDPALFTKRLHDAGMIVVHVIG